MEIMEFDYTWNRNLHLSTTILKSYYIYFKYSLILIKHSLDILHIKLSSTNETSGSESQEQTEQQSHLISKHCFNSLNNTVSTLFTFALAFTIPQVSVSDLHKHKKWLQKIKVWNLVFSGRVKYKKDIEEYYWLICKTVDNS